MHDDRDDELEEHTLVIDRTSPSADDAADDEDAHTIVIDREIPAVGDDDESDDEHTLIIDRASPSDDDESEERTIVVDRAETGLDESTIVVAREQPDADESTIVVDRGESAAPSLRRGRGERRRGIAPPPVPAGFAPPAREAVGPGAIESYAPRELPELPPDAAAALSDRGAPRAWAELPSVARRARRTGITAVAVFISACVVSVVGLALIAVFVF